MYLLINFFRIVIYCDLVLKKQTVLIYVVAKWCPFFNFTGRMNDGSLNILFTLVRKKHTN